ncbi:MAG TPA: family 43 glycosylhydrolase, partial [Microbacterium sp.]|nr:family 43 glycosylhydrolase [Microbacterium sp.]
MQAATYTNPIRSHDVPDPDAIALAGGGYALVASSFGRRPGLPLWYSADLVDWVPVGFAGGYAPALHASGGVWAPSIREHDGRIWITWADPDLGVFVVDAPELSGPWSESRLLLAGPGPIDPCPFWDEDGRTWIVHGWARSRAGFANRLDVFEVDAKLTGALSAPRV